MQIPPVPIQGNGFVYLVGCDSESARPSWRLGCSVRLSSDGRPDSGGLFTDPNGFPIRIDDRRPCTLGSYTLLTWPNLEIEQPWLILEFPFWLDDIEVEIFWYDGAITQDFFEQVRESVTELYNDPDFATQTGEASETRIIELINDHKQEADPHQQYLLESEASLVYATQANINSAISSHVAQSNPHQITAAMIGAATADDFDSLAQDAIAQSGVYTDDAIASHLNDDNPHQITPEAIGAVSSELTEASFSYGSGWIQYSSDYAVKARKLGPLAVLEGLVRRNSSNSSDKTILILPIGFRPQNRLVFNCFGVNNGQPESLRIDVEANGAVSLIFPAIASSIPWLSLGGISFIAA